MTDDEPKPTITPEERFNAMMAIAKRAAQRPVFDSRTPDEIIGMTDDGGMFSHPELLTEIAIRAFAKAAAQAIAENDRLGIPSYGSEGGKIVVRHPPKS
jgi:hypothetical protein